MNITPEKYANILYELTEGKSQEETSSAVFAFAEILKENKDLGKLKEIFNKFERIWKEKQNAVDANVLSSQELSEEMKEKIKLMLAKKSGKSNVFLRTAINKSLIGGFMIEIEDERIDATISGRLKGLENKLSN